VTVVTGRVTVPIGVTIGGQLVVHLGGGGGAQLVVQGGGGQLVVQGGGGQLPLHLGGGGGGAGQFTQTGGAVGACVGVCTMVQGQSSMISVVGSVMV